MDEEDRETETKQIKYTVLYCLVQQRRRDGRLI